MYYHYIIIADGLGKEQIPSIGARQLSNATKSWYFPPQPPPHQKKKKKSTQDKFIFKITQWLTEVAALSSVFVHF